MVPFSCLFIYEAVRAYVSERAPGRGRLPWLAAAAACAAAAVLLRARLYTCTVLAAASAFFLAAALVAPGLLWGRRFWIAIGLSYVPFLLFNGILTGLPVVTYGEKAIVGIRLLSIPAEDFFYSFSLLGFAMLAYTRVRRSDGAPRSP